MKTISGSCVGLSRAGQVPARRVSGLEDCGAGSAGQNMAWRWACFSGRIFGFMSGRKSGRISGGVPVRGPGLFAALCLCLLVLASTASTASTDALAGAAGPDAGGELRLLDASGAIVAAWPLAEGQAFAIRYTHSVAQTPVEDQFRIKGGVIHLDRTIYRDFGAGLPTAPEGGQSMRVEKGRVVISGFDRPLPAFDLRVGRVAGHTLILFSPADGAVPVAEMPLARLARPGSALTVTYAPGTDDRASR